MKEAGFFPQNRTFPPREENVSITFQADTEITSDDGIINVSYLLAAFIFQIASGTYGQCFRKSIIVYVVKISLMS